MKNRKYIIFVGYIFIFSTLILLARCKKEIVSPRDYPRADIEQKINFTDSGAEFEGVILFEGDSDILDKGFVWSTLKAPKIFHSRVSAGVGFTEGTFKAIAEVDLQDGSIYNVCAYVKTDKKIVYSKSISFESQVSSLPHQLLDFYPQEGGFSDTLKIRGKYMSFLKESISVWFDELEATIYSCTDTTIVLTVPTGIKTPTSILSVKRLANTKMFEQNFQLKPPEIIDFNPKTIDSPGTILSISGKNFNSIPQNNTVYIGGIEVDVISATENILTVDPYNSIVVDYDLSLDDYFNVSVTVAEQSAVANTLLQITNIGKWTKMNDFPGQARLYSISSESGGKGYYGFGRNIENGTFYKDFWEFDPAQNEWKEMAIFPGVIRANATCFELEGNIYVCCGASDIPINNSTNLSEVWEYDPGNDTWLKKNDFTAGPRYDAFGFSFNGKGYIGGGRHEGSPIFNDLWEYNATSDQWLQKRDIPDVENDYGLLVINAYSTSTAAYIIGRVHAERLNHGELLRYNVAQDSWTRMESLPSTTIGEYYGFVVKDRLYAGTYIYHTYFKTNSFFSYDSESNRWAIIGFKGLERKFANCFSIGDFGYVLGGLSLENNEQLKDVWQFDPDL